MKVEAELQKICDGILALMNNNFIPAASTCESMVFYFKMKGSICSLVFFRSVVVQFDFFVG